MCTVSQPQSAAGNINTLASNVSIYVCLLGTANCYMVKCRVDSTTTISHHRPFTTGSSFDKHVRSTSSSKVEQRRGIGHATTAAVLDITGEESCLSRTPGRNSFWWSRGLHLNHTVLVFF